VKFWNKPARQKKEIHPDDFVCDLDALESKAVFFKFKGQAFEIPPISTGKLLKVYASFMQVDALARKNVISADELIDTYTDLFSSVCPQVTREVVSQMTQAQAGALFALVFDTVSGRVGASKKKLDLMNQMRSESLKG
jgi:hypothetical protein